jgi:NodT family efflux transporter outer membrane factor (OMF) lipoprotein
MTSEHKAAVSSRVLGALPTGLFLLAFLLIFLFILGGCAVGPKYVRPATPVPATYKESGNWITAQPSDEIPRGTWWEVFRDPELNSLEDQIQVSNQNLKIAEAQYQQARAMLRISRSNYFPTITGGLSVAPTQLSENRPLSTLSKVTNYTDYQLPIDASYEPDVWGRVRRTVEASRSEAQASDADLATVNLSLHAELAMDYFELRGLDAQKQLLDSTVDAYQKALALTQSRFRGGIASALDVAQAQTQLDTTRAQDVDLEVARAQYEHAIAVLTGQPPAEFALPASPLNSIPPITPPGLPSDLLQRRPDIAAAERRVEESNAEIGVARSAYFPLVMLSGEGGFESTDPSNWFSGPSVLWAVGASAAETIFDAGRRHAVTDQARAAYDQSVASYRETVLTAFQDVEDNLAALRVLADESSTQDAAVSEAERSLDLSLNLYKGGATDYLTVITAQSTALSDERAAVDISTRRMVASVLLVKALGGGWDAASLPKL